MLYVSTVKHRKGANLRLQIGYVVLLLSFYLNWARKDEGDKTSEKLIKPTNLIKLWIQNSFYYRICVCVFVYNKVLSNNLAIANADQTNRIII